MLRQWESQTFLHSTRHFLTMKTLPPPVSDEGIALQIRNNMSPANFDIYLLHLIR